MPVNSEWAKNWARELILTVDPGGLITNDMVDKVAEKVLAIHHTHDSGCIADPDYVYEDTDPEGTTFPWAGRMELAEIIEPELGELYQVKTIYEGPSIYLAKVMVETDDPEEPATEIKWFRDKRQAEVAMGPKVGE